MEHTQSAAERLPTRGSRLSPFDSRRLARKPILIALDGLRGAALILVGLLFVALTAWLDLETGPYLSLSIFYLIPVAACAWCGGFCYGILFSLAGALAWHIVDAHEIPDVGAVTGLWNGVVRFGTLVMISSLVSRLHASILREHLLARTDPLTGAANGRTFYEALAVEGGRARRAERPLTLAYLDLDDFKQLNDRLGHTTGDTALKQVVEVITPHLRDADVLARLGGDEFALLLPDTDGPGALALLARVRDLLSEEMRRRRYPVTLSIGAITFMRPFWDVDLMIQRVDALMYAAKRNGKNRVEHATVRHTQRERTNGAATIERRATARVLCNRAARVRPEGQQGDDEFATVSNISATGVGVHLDTRFDCDTVLVIDPLFPGVKGLLARVVYLSPEGGGWNHGCELTIPLSEEELQGWLGEAMQPVEC